MGRKCSQGNILKSKIMRNIATSFFSIGKGDAVITQTISLRARLQPLGVGIHTHTLLNYNKYALTIACITYVVLKPTKPNNEY